jgi:flavin-dependent amine oxidoreductase
LQPQPNSSSASYRGRTGLHQLRADRCVCALPFAPPRRVKMATPQKMAAIHKLRYMAAARCYFQTRSRFWEHDPLGGLNFGGTDTIAGRVWNTSSQQPATRSAAEQQVHPPYELWLPHPHGSSGEDVVRDHRCRSSQAVVSSA